MFLRIDDTIIIARRIVIGATQLQNGLAGRIARVHPDNIHYDVDFGEYYPAPIALSSHSIKINSNIILQMCSENNNKNFVKNKVDKTNNRLKRTAFFKINGDYTVQLQKALALEAPYLDFPVEFPYPWIFLPFCVKYPYGNMHEDYDIAIEEWLGSNTEKPWTHWVHNQTQVLAFASKRDAETFLMFKKLGQFDRINI